MSKAIVIVRHLPDCEPVAHAVISVGNFRSTDYSVESHLEELAKENVKEFKKEFVEFNKANFYFSIMEITSG